MASRVAYDSLMYQKERDNFVKETRRRCHQIDENIKKHLNPPKVLTRDERLKLIQQGKIIKPSKDNASTYARPTARSAQLSGRPSTTASERRQNLSNKRNSVFEEERGYYADLDSGPPVSEEWLDHMTVLLRDKIDQRTGGGPMEIYRQFKDFDTDGNGTITRVEFKGVLNRMNFFLNDRQAKALMRRFDDDESGSLSFYEFCQKLLNPSRGNRKGKQGDVSVLLRK